MGRMTGKCCEYIGHRVGESCSFCGTGLKDGAEDNCFVPAIFVRKLPHHSV